MTGRIFYNPSIPPYSVSQGQVEIQSIPIIWSTNSPVRKEITLGEDYWEPSTGEISNLPGKPRYPNVTVTGIFNRQVGLFILNFFNNDIRAKDGTLTATYTYGDVNNQANQFVATLLKVRLINLELPASDKLGTAAAMITLEFSYNGIKAVAQQ